MLRTLCTSYASIHYHPSCLSSIRSLNHQNISRQFNHASYQSQKISLLLWSLFGILPFIQWKTFQRLISISTQITSLWSPCVRMLLHGISRTHHDALRLLSKFFGVYSMVGQTRMKTPLPRSMNRSQFILLRPMTSRGHLESLPSYKCLMLSRSRLTLANYEKSFHSVMTCLSFSRRVAMDFVTVSRRRLHWKEWTDEIPSTRCPSRPSLCGDRSWKSKGIQRLKSETYHNGPWEVTGWSEQTSRDCAMDEERALA